MSQDVRSRPAEPGARESLDGLDGLDGGPTVASDVLNRLLSRWPLSLTQITQ